MRKRGSIQVHLTSPTLRRWPPATASRGSNHYAFAYSGRQSPAQTVNGTPINYTVDIDTDLAVELTDGTNSYLYRPAVGSV